ncbi:MAG: sigma-70 family RNA polymerase sigma factor [Acidobacteria bacterium]|nr:sigma-70 family RNA polymerase sigma factor [Acidobacteriota bacterium]
MPELISRQEETEDRELVAATLDGDQDAFTLLVQRYERRIVNYVRRIIRRHEDAHDLAQDIFIKVYMALDRYDPKYEFSTWLFRIAQNAAIDVVRKKGIIEESLVRPGRDGEGEQEMDVEGEEVSPYRSLSNKQMAAAMELAIERLPDDYRDLIDLRHFGELSYEEIAAVKGMPLGTVKNKLFRARNVLKGELEHFLEP